MYIKDKKFNSQQELDDVIYSSSFNNKRTINDDLIFVSCKFMNKIIIKNSTHHNILLNNCNIDNIIFEKVNSCKISLKSKINIIQFNDCNFVHITISEKIKNMFLNSCCRPHIMIDSTTMPTIICKGLTQISAINIQDCIYDKPLRKYFKFSKQCEQVFDILEINKHRIKF